MAAFKLRFSPAAKATLKALEDGTSNDRAKLKKVHKALALLEQLPGDHARGEAEAGLIHVNSQTAGADVHVPFGGIKSSGFGPHEQGRAAIEFYTETVTVYVDP